MHRVYRSSLGDGSDIQVGLCAGDIPSANRKADKIHPLSRELQDDGQDTISLPSQISNGAIQECARQKHPLKRQPVRSTFSGCVTLSNGITMAHWELSDEIALIARVGSIVIAQSSAAVEKNVEHFRDAVVQIRNLEATR